MHDEASAHYVSMIDQTTLGHEFLKRELDYYPRVGWQIDPFGHSKTHAWLSSEVGFDALFFGRIDYQDHNLRMDESRMEMVWKGSKASPDVQVFTGAFQDGNYGPPSGFCFDTSCGYCRSDPVVSDPHLSTYNIDTKVDQFIAAILEEKSHSVGSNIMFKMGSDFAWDNAHTWFKSIDKIIEAVNAQDDRFEVFYSTPENYMLAKAQENIVWTDKSDDFFPYSDCEHCFWAGYFTSRPTLKYMERGSSSFLQAVKQVSSAKHNRDKKLASQETVSKFTAAVGLINHHDAMTGTSKQHVADDYMKIISSARTESEAFLSSIVASPLDPLVYSYCRLANESFCEVTQSLVVGETGVVLVYNPLPRSRTEQVSVYLSDIVRSPLVRVSVSALSSGDNVQAKLVPSDVMPTAPFSPNPSAAPYTLVFSAENLPPLSSTRFLVRLDDYSSITDKSAESAVATEEYVEEVGEPLVISNDKVAVTFSRATGLMTSISLSDGTASAEVSNELRYYKSFGSPGMAGYKYSKVDKRDPHLQNIKPSSQNIGAESMQASGAYIFRPSLPDEEPAPVAEKDALSRVAEISVVRGKNVIEVRQVVSITLLTKF